MDSAEGRSGPAATPASVDAVNRTSRYALWAVYERANRQIETPDEAVAELVAWSSALSDGDVALRGAYDVSALRAGCDVMLWLHGPSADSLQAAARGFRRTFAGRQTRLAWSAMGTHRPAEFSRDHVPSFMQGTDPLRWLCVYPFVRSYEWYLLPAEERAAMLREHGIAGRAFAGVQANTVAAFALSDFEWVLALESNDLHELVDLMRDLRATEARRHVRLEIPFYTGHRIEIPDMFEILG